MAPWLERTGQVMLSMFELDGALAVVMLVVFVLGFLGLAYSLYPWVVIDRLTIWQAASSPAALKVILVGVCISVPAIVAYTVFSYRVFGGKTGELRYA